MLVAVGAACWNGVEVAGEQNVGGEEGSTLGIVGGGGEGGDGGAVVGGGAGYEVCSLG